MEPRAREELSPFELKDDLLRYARDFTTNKAATHTLLDAGRGNPNWIATTPRLMFFLLGRFAIGEAQRVWAEPHLAGMPHADGIADRLRQFLARQYDDEAAEMLVQVLDFCVEVMGFDADRVVHELTDAIAGDNYPYPDRMLVHCEHIVRAYIEKEMFDDRPPPGQLDLFATEGGTAAMCYVFDSLMRNGFLGPGDTVAIGAPIFAPYVELCESRALGLHTVAIRQSEMSNGRHTWQYPDEELEALLDPQIKVLFLVNPSNPASFALSPETHTKLVELVRTKRPGLLIVTDDVYGTFVDGFRSLAADLPGNTILIYSFSKFFGCTGWRLGVVALNRENVVDRRLAELSHRDQVLLADRYSSITSDVDHLRFIDRMVADSRMVALDHTAGLSTPQQAQMALFSLFALLDIDDAYERRCREILARRFHALLSGFGVEVPHDPLRVGYYVDFDLEAWGRRVIGDDFVEYVKEHREPIDLVIGLAKRYGTVLLSGSGFEGPTWSVRISLANLDEKDCAQIGRNLKDIIAHGVARWHARKE